MWGVVGVLLFLGVGVVLGEDFSLVILHNNDMHARFEETERNSGTCKESHRNVSCIGGFARTAHEIRRYRQMAKEGKIPDVLYLNAGDTYVGTSWFSVFTWNISAEFINALRPDAMCLGNHEFDKGEEELKPFLQHVKSPVVAANLNFSEDPTLASLVNKSVVLNVSGRRVGIVGYLIPDTKIISSAKTTTFSDEIEAVRTESERLRADGVDIIIALGHSGYETDQIVAKEVELVDIVIGGHTNTFLWNGNQPDLETIDGDYPTIVTQTSGKKVPVVQAYAYTKYLGVLNVTFDENGDLTQFNGQPEFLNSAIPQEEDVLALLEVYRSTVESLDEEIVGSTKVILDGADNKCRHSECNFGNLIADSFVMYVASLSTQTWTNAPIALLNAGTIRNTINPTVITRGQLLGSLPYSNQLVTVTLKGSDLVSVLEQGARSDGKTSAGEFLQLSGMRVVYDWSRPPLSRVTSVRVRCGNCAIPAYQDLDVNGNYTVVTNDFLTSGGDGHTVLKNNGWDYKTQDLSDLDVVVWYLKRYSPVYPELQGRIQVLNAGNNGDGSNFGSRIRVNVVGVAMSVFLILFQIM